MALLGRFCQLYWSLLAIASLCHLQQGCQGGALTEEHPDKSGLLALKASICGVDCPALSSWNESATVCSQLGYEGVYCAWVEGMWRAVSVQLQLQAPTVTFNDSQLVIGGSVQGIQYLKELEIVCYKSTISVDAAPSTDATALSAVPMPVRSLQMSASTFNDPAGNPRSTFLHTNSSLESASRSPARPSAAAISLTSSEAQQLSAAYEAAASLPEVSTAPAVGELPPRWFVAYPHLQQLRVTGCGAGGQLPAELLLAKQLSSLVLSRNKIRGTLPHQLVLLQHLTLLDLSGNQLSGTLPAAWSALPQLSYLYLNQNNITLNELPCEWARMLSLKLADISGNKYKPTGIGAEPGAAPAGAPNSSVGCWASRRTAYLSSTHSSSSQLSTASNSSSWLGSELRAGQKFGVLRGPRCWLRRFCYDEGAFICLERSKKHPTAGCTSYIYGSSDLHIDPANQCDHGGTHLVAIAGLWMGLLAALLLIYLHHCRLLRRLTEPPEQRRRRQQRQQQQQWQGLPHQRQWLVTSGPAASPRAVPSASAGTEGTLPLLYYAASSHEDAAGYVRPASPGACSLDAAMAEAEGLLPSALQTPPINTTRVMVVRGLGSSANAHYDDDSDRSGSSLSQDRQAGTSRLGRLGGSKSALSRGSGYFSPGLSAAGGRDSSSTCFNPELLLPLAFALLDVTTDLRLLMLWGFWPHEVKLWPSYVLLGLIALPHVLVGAVVHFRLLAAACLPPAVQAASASVETDILPPGSRLIILLYSWLFSAPWWLAYPLILLLLAPGIALLVVLCPLTLLLHAFEVSSHAAVVRYVQLMQGCIALTEAPGTAVLLTVLFLMGNVPLEYAFLDGSLYYLNLVASMMDMCVAWWKKLDGVRQWHALQLAEAEIPPAGVWS